MTTAPQVAVGAGRRVARRPPSRGRPRSSSGFSSWCRAAVGLEQARGDQMTVENIAFDEASRRSRAAAEPWCSASRTSWQSDTAHRSAAALGVVVLGLLASSLFVRPMMHRGAVPQRRRAPPRRAAAVRRRPVAVTTRSTIGGCRPRWTAASRSAAEDAKLTVLTRSVVEAAPTKEPETRRRLMQHLDLRTKRSQIVHAARTADPGAARPPSS